MIRQRAALPILTCFVLSIALGCYLFDISIFSSTSSVYNAAIDHVAGNGDALFATTSTTPTHPTSIAYKADTIATAAQVTLTGKQALPRDWTFSDRAPEGLNSSWEKPKDLRIVGLVFFGRPPSASILDCYLKVWRIRSISILQAAS
jgi:hypothetical protein